MLGFEMQPRSDEATKNHKEGTSDREVPSTLPVTCHLSPVTIRLVALVLALLLASGHVPASAHGGGRPQLTNEPVGPYHLFVWTSPEPWRVGEVHTTVAVTRPLGDGQEMPVEDAQVVVTYAPVDAPAEARQVTAVEQGGTQPGFYEADTEVNATGDWEIRVAVSRSLIHI